MSLTRVHAHEGSVRITLDGDPIGKGRPRFGQGRVYTPSPTASYEAALKIIGRSVMRGRDLLDGPLVIRIVAHFAIPASMSKGLRMLASTGAARPDIRPDFDNIAKLACDALNKIVWTDDAKIVEATVLKVYGDRPRLEIAVWPWVPNEPATASAATSEAYGEAA